MPIQIFLTKIEASTQNLVGSTAGGPSQGDGHNQEPSPGHGTSQDNELSHDDGSSQGDVYVLDVADTSDGGSHDDGSSQCDVADTSDGGSQNVEHGQGLALFTGRKCKKQCPKL